MGSDGGVSFTSVADPGAGQDVDGDAGAGDAAEVHDDAADTVPAEATAVMAPSPCAEPPSEEDLLAADPWALVRLALGSMAGESWRLKQALVWPTEAFSLMEDPPCSEGDSWWDRFQLTQTYEVFRRTIPFRPNSTNDTVDLVILGDGAKLQEQLYLDRVVAHLTAFLGFRVVLWPEALALGKAMHSRKAPGASHQQVGAHHALAQLRNLANPRSACTIGLTTTDLYPPRAYDFVTGISDASQRVAVFSVARYFSGAPAVDPRTGVPISRSAPSGTLSRAPTLVPPPAPPATPGRSSPARPPSGPSAGESKEALSTATIRMLCREICKLCGMGECRLLTCLMNPFPGGPPEAVQGLPLSLCCVCLRKLQWLTQSDLIDRYARLPAVLSDWFTEETLWILERMVQIGMPTYASLRDAVQTRVDR